MMLGDQDEILGSSLIEELYPGLGVEVRCGKLGNEVVIVEVWHIGLKLMLIGRVLLIIHMIPVPLSIFLTDWCPGWYGIDAPVNKDTKFGVVEPVWSLMLREQGVSCSVLGNPSSQRESQKVGVPSSSLGHYSARDL